MKTRFEIQTKQGPHSPTAETVKVTAETEAGNGLTAVEISTNGYYSKPKEIEFAVPPGVSRQLAQFFSALADMEEA